MAKKADPEKEAIDRLKEAAFHPDMNPVWDKHPATYTGDDFPSLVGVLRTERALWQATEARRKRKAAAGAPVEQAEDGGEAW